MSLFPKERTPLEREREEIVYWDDKFDRIIRYEPQRAVELIMQEWHFAEESTRASMFAALAGRVAMTAARAKCSVNKE